MAGVVYFLEERNARDCELMVGAVAGVSGIGLERVCLVEGVCLGEISLQGRPALAFFDGLPTLRVGGGGGGGWYDPSACFLRGLPDERFTAG